MNVAAWLLAAGIAGLAGCSTQQGPPSAGAAAADAGARIYNGNCVACHQQNGNGVPGVYPSLQASPVVMGDARDLARWVIEGRRPPNLPAGRFSTVMPQFGWLKAGDAAALFTYLRTHFGNAGAPVEAAVVHDAVADT